MNDQPNDLQILGRFPMQSRLNILVAYFAIGLLAGCSAKHDEKAVLIPVQAMFR
jgi:hypothetical protein